MLTKYLLPCCVYQPECCYPWSPPATSCQHKSPHTGGVVDTCGAAWTTVSRQLVFFRWSWIYCSLSNSGQPKLTWYCFIVICLHSSWALLSPSFYHIRSSYFKANITADVTVIVMDMYNVIFKIPLNCSSLLKHIGWVILYICFPTN